MPVGSNHTMMTRMTPTEVSQVRHQLPSLPCIIGKLWLLLTTKPSGKKDNKPLPCSSSTRRDNHPKKPHGNDMKTCGNSKTKFESSCSNNAPWSSQYKLGESLMTYHAITPLRH
ncbi:hypothetical protein R3W88_008528 [Solanum pinnatisectum]|uniref:Uncharacterized protein n=1 Tax=Solanum pinnatisectum TaxID=50273 RepID=A0AAV9MA66_9SOLN|nr:hypothetical protein R3W88_008528 [Solanum pinnatisectum]